MIVVTVCNHKGGTGKTTTAMHLGAALGLSGHRTLVIDLDPQAFLTRMMGVKEPAPEASSLILFDQEAPLGEVPVQEMNGFDLLPATGALTGQMRRLNKPTDVLWAKEVVQRLDYDILLFDTAAAVTVYSLNALVASQHALIPVTPEYQPVVGAEQTYETTKLVRGKLNPALHPPLFIFTQVDARKREHYSYREYLRGKYGEQVMTTIIRTSSALATSHRDGTTVFDNAPRARGARDYANAADELLRRVQAASTSEASEEPASATADTASETVAGR